MIGINKKNKQEQPLENKTNSDIVNNLKPASNKSERKKNGFNQMGSGTMSLFFKYLYVDLKK